MVFARLIALTIGALCCWILTACSPLLPASAPPQLTHTPGAFVEIANGHFNAGSFQFDYPAAWHLVKEGAASADGMHIVLRAPSGGELSLRIVQTNTGEDGIFIPLAKGNFLMATVPAANDKSTNVTSEIEQIISSIRS